MIAQTKKKDELKISWSGFEPGLLWPQRSVLTTKLQLILCFYIDISGGVVTQQTSIK